MFHVDPRGILAVVAIAMCWSLAVVLFRTGGPGSMGRKLSLLLLFEGFTLGTSDALTYFLVDAPATFAQFLWLQPAQNLIHSFGDCAMLVLYPPFLALALNIRLTRPFGTRRVQLALLAVAVLLYTLVLTTPANVGQAWLYVAMALLFAFALVAAIAAWRIAQGAARQRALIFVLAFGFRDLCWGFVYTVAFRILWFDLGEVPPATANLLGVTYLLGTLVSVPLIAYGILRTQLFDIDLRIRWTIKQSTLAATIIAIIFFVSEGASQLLSAELGSVFGLLAAAVVMFFLAPLQRFAERVATAAMPNTENTPEYIAFRKMQVYETAVSEAQFEGGISPRERNLLNHLRDSLGISEADAAAIERELAAQAQ